MKFIIGLIIVGVILVAAAFTNPKKDQFITWAKADIKSQTHIGLVNWGIDEFGGSILSSVTTEQNYLFFTIYDVNIANFKEIRVIGVFNHFIPVSIGSEKTMLNLKNR